MRHTLHSIAVEATDRIEAHETGIDLGDLALHFDDDAEISRAIVALEIARHRLREQANLPDPDPESLDAEAGVVEVFPHVSEVGTS